MTQWPFGESEMAARIRAHDWAPTPLGAIAGWPQVLRTAVDIMLAMPSPATILWGPQHVQLYNDAYITIARDRHPLLLGRPVADGWPDAHDTVIARLLESARTGRATQLTAFPVPLHGPDGVEERVFDTDWVPIHDEFGAVAGTLQTLAEATDRLKAQTAMRESEARHRLLIGSWAQAVWETDPNGVVIADSPSWRAYTGQTLQEWLGYGWLDAIHPDDRPYAERQWREATAAHGLVDAEFRLRDANGGWGWTNVRAAPVLDAQGNIEKWAGMNINIDARRRAEAVLRESEQRQSFLLKLSDALAPLADPIQIQAEAARVLGEQVEADRVAYYETDGDDYLIEKDWGRSGASLAGRHSIKSFGDDLVEKHRQGQTTVVVADIADAHSEAQQRSFAEIGVRAYVGITLVKDGRFVGGLTLHSILPRAWTPDEVKMARETAERTWAATERARAEEALRKSEERQTFQLTLSDALASLADPQAIQAEAARLLAGQLGVSRCYFNEFDDGSTHATVLGDFHDDGLPSMVGVHDLSGEQGFLDLMCSESMLDMPDLTSAEQFSAQARSAYGALGIRAALGTPLLRNGRLAAVLLVADTRVRQWTNGDRELLRGAAERTWAAIQRARAEAALGESEDRQRALIEGVPQFVWRAGDPGQWTWCSPQWTRFTGQAEQDSRGWGWLEPLHPDDRGRAREAWAHAIERGILEVDYRICEQQGVYRWFQTRATPIRDASGTITEWLGTSTDIDDLRGLQERQRILVGELQHRTRNLMGVTRSIADKTMRQSATMEEFQRDFSARLDALARVQSLLSRVDNQYRVTFDELICAELAAHGVAGGDEGRVILRGIRGIPLRSGMVQMLALALHELATNAVKYGALRERNGRLEIGWRTLQIDGLPDRLEIIWEEHGVIMPPDGMATKRTGQGRELIERALPYQLDAETRYDVGPDGIKCQMIIPVSGALHD
ncbi:hypothetical protein GCM10011404_24150 [Sphingomonas prati]|nr:hypothetical protein GCM10011404_24150 [Sphingomonas prati]